MITVKAPGKLYIAGEYAIVESGNPAILVAVNQCLQVTIDKSPHDYGTITSQQYPGQDLIWCHQDNQFISKNNAPTFLYVTAAIRTVEEYVLANHGQLTYFDIRITSDLDNANGKKYGLGSSAAVTVAVVKAVSQLYHLNLDQLSIFKLAAIAHLTTQGNGSLGDVAASVYGGWIAYQSFDRTWLKSQLQFYPIDHLLKTQWPKLCIEQLNPPTDLNLLVGWTGSVASTSKMVSKNSLTTFRQTNAYQQFVLASQACVNKMINAFHQHDLRTIQQQLIINRKLLNQLAVDAQLNIETPTITKLCDIAKHHHGVGKSSGAGGGDCGIVIIDRQYPTALITSEWQNNHILPLPFHVSPSIGV